MPADGILTRGALIADESSLTGESETVRKEPHRSMGCNTNPFLISGSTITEGTGYMIVCAVGSFSQIGKSKEMMQFSEDPTPLQEKLEEIATDIGKMGTGAALMLFIALLTYIIVDAIQMGKWSSESWKDLVNSLVMAITIIVVAVPEGLPTCCDSIASILSRPDEGAKQLCEAFAGLRNYGGSHDSFNR